MTRRFNIVDLAIGLVVLILIPMGYAAFLLFRPAKPVITSVELVPSTNIEERAAAGSALGGKLKVRGEGLRPILRAMIGNQGALAFIFETPTSADVLFGPLAPGRYDLVLFDGVQEVARAPKAVNIAPTISATRVRVRVVGTLFDVDEAQARGLNVGDKFPAAGEPAAEVAALGATVPDMRGVGETFGRIEVAVEGRWQRKMAVFVSCDLGGLNGNEECRVGGDPVGAFGVPLRVPGAPGWMKLRIDEVVPAAPPRPGEARVRFIGNPELINLVRVGDVDDATLATDGRAASIVAITSQQVVQGDTSVTIASEGTSDPIGIRAADRVAIFDAVLRLGLDPSTQGFRYRAHVLKVGGALTFRTDRYVMRGTVVSFEPGPDCSARQNEIAMADCQTSDREFDDVARLALESEAFGLLARIGTAGRLLVAESRVSSEMERAQRTLASLDGAVRARLGGILLICAGLTHAVLLAVLPSVEFGVLPFLTAALVALAGMALLLAPR